MIRSNPELTAYMDKLFERGVHDIREEEFRAKQLIIEQDHRYHNVYVIREGIAKCYITDENGKDFIQEFLGAGMEFGELEVFNNKLTICSVETITPLKTYSLSHKSFNVLLKEDMEFNRLIMKALADKIRYKAPRHSYQHSYPIENNILRLKQLFPELTDVISKKDIANYIGVTTRSLNRALKELNEKSG
ncbi:Crp/Fnr family transcriptional regulator [Flagellimonas nanhaiensis]|uniref:Crp/Fnr family transcriptional regulator n=1 Tax=Flagellimonas nanhaiensis TaxID=2292706 RepID=A0A371JUP9_9FLAO|nr:Crp/Fnr family transcriptional regulator [Allomuricauda nanhaiensis]RDY61507.1 Crp/Fnr family transcriptional regulator [Allomuricauda nanhaiensis]